MSTKINFLQEIIPDIKTNLERGYCLLPSDFYLSDCEMKKAISLFGRVRD